MATMDLRPSKIVSMFNAKDRLPINLQVLFELLFIKGLTEEQAGVRLKLGIDKVNEEKTMLLKALKSSI